MPQTIHIIGAGLAGLSAAIELTAQGRSVVVHEATAAAGGRCRSYHDHTLGMVIDNGNHLLLSGNRSALSYLRAIGAENRLISPPHSEFLFVDLAGRKDWTLRITDGRLPWWIFDARRRVPDTRAIDYLRFARLLWATPDNTVGDLVKCSGTVYQRLLQPLLLAALNIDPPAGSAALAGAVLRETIATGGQACRPLFAREGLGSTLVEPALALLAQRNSPVQLGHQLHAIRHAEGRITALDFGKESISLAPDDVVILAVPPYAAAALVPGLQTPTEFRAIVNAHFRIDPPKDMPAIMGVVNATTEWIFTFPGRISTTISAGDRLIDTSREALAQTVWSEVAAIAKLPATLPPWQIVRERRATFAATPAQNARRPGPRTAWSNLVLAGDWTNTGLPATIESAIRSGHRAAETITQR